MIKEYDMNDSELVGNIVAMLLGAFLGFILGAIILGNSCAKQYRDKAIENNAAHYDLKTGDFTWNNEVKP